MPDVRKGRKGWQMEIADVVNVVVAVFDVSARQILEGGENQGARDAAIYLARKHIDLCYLPELEQAFHADRKTIVEKSFLNNLEQGMNFSFKEELAFADEEIRRLRSRGHSYPVKHEDRSGVCE